MALDSRQEDDLKYLRETIQIAKESRDGGHHPFGAVLVGPDDEIFLQSGIHSKKTRVSATLKPMSHGQQAGYSKPSFSRAAHFLALLNPAACVRARAIGRALGMTEKRLAALIGDEPENLTLDLSCEQLFAAGQGTVKTRGP